MRLHLYSSVVALGVTAVYAVVSLADRGIGVSLALGYLVAMGTLMMFGVLHRGRCRKPEQEATPGPPPGTPERRRNPPLGDPVFHKRTARALAVMALFLVIVAGVLGYQYNQQRAILRRIQDERAFSIRRSCQDTNDRHDRTVARLDAKLGVVLRHSSPKRAARIRQSRRFSVALIDALAPKQDCSAVVRARVSPVK